MDKMIDKSKFEVIDAKPSYEDIPRPMSINQVKWLVKQVLVEEGVIKNESSN